MRCKRMAFLLAFLCSVVAVAAALSLAHAPVAWAGDEGGNPLYRRPSSLTFGSREKLETLDWLHFQTLKELRSGLLEVTVELNTTWLRVTLNGDRIVDLPPWADPIDLTRDTWPHHGVTVLVVSPLGQVKARHRFVTYHPGQSSQLLRFVSSVQPGNLLLFLAVPEWLLFMSEEAKQALGALGFRLGGLKTCNSEAWVGAAILREPLRPLASPLHGPRDLQASLPWNEDDTTELHGNLKTKQGNAELTVTKTGADESSWGRGSSRSFAILRRPFIRRDTATKDGTISKNLKVDEARPGRDYTGLWSGQMVAEAIATTPKVPRPIALSFNLPLNKFKSTRCSWHEDKAMETQMKFCRQYDGYDDLCRCHDPFTRRWTLKQPLIEIREEIPFAVVTAKSPHRLYRTIRSLFNASGSSQTELLLVIDGIQEEVGALAQVLGVPFVVHKPQGRPGSNVRPNTNVRFALESVFDVFANCDKAVILEDDLIVSPDIIRYFQETSWLLDADPTILAVNAFSYNSVSGVAADISRLRRVEAYPYYGWMMSRAVARQAVRYWMNDEEGDWDKWLLRDNRTRQGRDVIVPEVSRTYHDGGLGVHVSGFVQAVFYEKIIVNTDRNAVLQDLTKLLLRTYERELAHELRRARMAGVDVLSADVLPGDGPGPFVTYVSASTFLDETYSFTTIMMGIGTFYWDTHEMFRGVMIFNLRGRLLYVVGCPLSKLYCRYGMPLLTPSPEYRAKVSDRTEQLENNLVNPFIQTRVRTTVLDREVSLDNFVNANRTFQVGDRSPDGRLIVETT